MIFAVEGFQHGMLIFVSTLGGMSHFVGCYIACNIKCKGLRAIHVCMMVDKLILAQVADGMACSSVPYLDH